MIPQYFMDELWDQFEDLEARFKAAQNALCCVGIEIDKVKDFKRKAKRAYACLAEGEAGKVIKRTGDEE